MGTPNVIFKQEGKEKLEPIEEVTADVDADQIGLVIERLTARKGELKEMKQFGTRARLTFLVPVWTSLLAISLFLFFFFFLLSIFPKFCHMT